MEIFFEQIFGWGGKCCFYLAKIVVGGGGDTRDLLKQKVGILT